MNKKSIVKVVAGASAVAIAVAKAGVFGGDVSGALMSGASLAAVLMHFLHLD